MDSSDDGFEDWVVLPVRIDLGKGVLEGVNAVFDSLGDLSTGTTSFIGNLGQLGDDLNVDSGSNLGSLKQILCCCDGGEREL